MYLMHGKKIKDIGFVAGELQYPPNWIALATNEEREALGIVVVPDPVRPDERLGDIIENEDGSYTLLPWELSVLIDNACNKIDNTVSSIYTKWTRFEKEYNLRLAAAKAYVESGYAIEANIYLESVAVSANISLQEAAEQVMSQAVMFDFALEQLAAARMRKFEIKRTTEPSVVLELQDAILAQISTIAAQLS